MIHPNAVLDQLAATGHQHQARPTMAGAHLAPVSDPQHFALHIAAVHGRVNRGGREGQAPVRVLTALARKGFLRLTAHPGPRTSNWAYGEITEAGRRELARLDAIAADTARREAAHRPYVAITRQVDPFALCQS